MIFNSCAIISGALKECPQDDSLLIGMLVTAKDVLDETELHLLWESTLKDHSSNVALILSFARFKMSHFSTFSAHNQREVFIACIQKLRVVYDTAKASTNDELTVRTEDAMLQIFYLAVACEKMLGYNERAVAMFQAVCEFNFETPSMIQSVDAAAKLQYFEAYWDSEAPRIGDEQNCSWSGWLDEMTKKLRGEFDGAAESMPPALPKRKRAADFFSTEDEKNVTLVGKNTAMHRDALMQAFAIANTANSNVISAAAPSRDTTYSQATKVATDHLNKKAEVVLKVVQKEEAPRRFGPEQSVNETSGSDALIGIPYDVIGDADGEGFYYSVRHGRRIRNASESADALYQKLGDKLEESERIKEAAKEKTVVKLVDPLFTYFIAMEDHCTSQQWIPVRSTVNKAIAESHPERVTFFEDIVHFLFPLPERKIQEVIINFLLLLGVKLPDHTSTNSCYSRQNLLSEDGSGYLSRYVSLDMNLDEGIYTCIILSLS